MKKLTKCENCGSNLVYSPVSGAVVCDYCNSTYPVPTSKKNIKLLRKYTLDYLPQTDPTMQNMYVCNSCGSAHTVAGDKPSTRCPSCGDTDVKNAAMGAIFPDGIVPYELTKEKAVEIFQKWLKKRKFAPSDLYQLAKNGKIIRTYVPVYNINATSVCAFNGMVKKVHTDDSSGTIFSTVHTVQDVSTKQIDNHALCANKVVNTDLIEKIISVDQNKIVPFSNEYLLGYYGMETNLNIHDLLQDYTKKLDKKLEDSIRHKLKNKYDEIVSLSCSTSLRNVSFNYAYVPVYMNHYTYKKKKYQCYISGTTGKVEGSSPKSAGKILGLIAGVALAIGAVVIACLKIFG